MTSHGWVTATPQPIFMKFRMTVGIDPGCYMPKGFGGIWRRLAVMDRQMYRQIFIFYFENISFNNQKIKNSTIENITVVKSSSDSAKINPNQDPFYP